MAAILKIEKTISHKLLDKLYGLLNIMMIMFWKSLYTLSLVLIVSADISVTSK